MTQDRAQDRERESARAAGPLAALAGLTEAIGSPAASTPGPRKLPPVHLWDPPYCGDIGMRIAADGTWFYQGSPIGRLPLVQLFASVLRRDADGRHYLVTPVEKVGVDIDDAPFLAVEMTVAGTGQAQVLSFRTTVGDWAVCGPEHPLRFSEEQRSGGKKPYIDMRAGLEALVSRPVYYDLVALGDIAPVNGIPCFGVWSSGQFFPMSEAAESGL